MKEVCLKTDSPGSKSSALSAAWGLGPPIWSMEESGLLI